MPDHSGSMEEQAVLESLLWMNQPSRLMLAQRHGFSKSKVTTLVSGLLEREEIEEHEELPSNGGRRAAGLQLHRGKGVLVAIDLGATGVEVAVCSIGADLLGTRSAPTDVRTGPGAVLAAVLPLIDGLLAELGHRREHVLGIGMGVPGPVELATGLLISPPLMPSWEGFSLREYFAELFDAPVVVDNDVNLMALGELHHARRSRLSSGHENFIVVKLGTGIGAGVIAQGQVFRGADGAAGDIGHICVDPEGPRCHCGNAGCLEALAGGPGIVREALRAAREGCVLLARCFELQGTLTVQDVGLAARQGDEAANRILQRAGNQIGQVLSGLVNFMNPSQVLIGGGVSQVGPLMLASIRQSVYARSLPLSTRKLRIDHTRLGDAAGLRGAAVLAAQHRLHTGGRR